MLNFRELAESAAVTPVTFTDIKASVIIQTFKDTHWATIPGISEDPWNWSDNDMETIVNLADDESFVQVEEEDEKCAIAVMKKVAHYQFDMLRHLRTLLEKQEEPFYRADTFTEDMKLFLTERHLHATAARNTIIEAFAFAAVDNLTDVLYGPESAQPVQNETHRKHINQILNDAQEELESRIRDAVDSR